MDLIEYFYAKNSSLEYWGCSKVVSVQYLKRACCFKYFVGTSAKKEKKKEKSCSEKSF